MPDLNGHDYDAIIDDEIGVFLNYGKQPPDKLARLSPVRAESGENEGEIRPEYGYFWSQDDWRGGSLQRKFHRPTSDQTAFFSSKGLAVTPEGELTPVFDTALTLDWSAGGSTDIEAAIEEVQDTLFAAWGGLNGKSNIVFRHDGEFPGSWAEEDVDVGEAGATAEGPTRMYLQNDAAPAAPGFSGGWGANSGVRRKLAKSKVGAVAEASLIQTVSPGALAQFVSEPLAAGQDFAVTDEISAAFDVRETQTSPEGANSPATLADDAVVGTVPWTDPANAAASDNADATAAFPVVATAPTSGGTFASDSSIGDSPWTDPSNAAASDDSRAIATPIDIAASEGPNDPTGTSSTGWSTPSEIAASDDAYASYLIPGGGTSAHLVARTLGFNIPADATITGIIAEIERHGPGGTIKDKGVTLVKTGTAPAGSNLAKAALWPTTDAYATYGSSTEMWGQTWTPAEINAVTFGVRLTADNTFGLERNAHVDHIRVTVHYTRPSTTTEYLKATNFGFAIPANAIIKGITAEVERFVAGVADAADNSVRLVKGGVIGGTDKASSNLWPTVDTIATYGGSSDLWGTTWTPAQVNAADFGFVISATTGDTANVDHIRLTVHYIEGDTHYLKATDLGFSIPTGATITGVMIEVEKRANAPASIRDSSVRIIKGGSYVGTDKADTSSFWFIGDTYKVYGGPSDLWGETWTPAEINAADFGAAIAAAYAGSTVVDAFIDHIRVTVYFTTSTTLALIVKMMSAADALQATLYDNTGTGTGTDWADSGVSEGGTVRTRSPAVLSGSYTTVAGDYLVVEVGFRSNNEGTAFLAYGGTGFDLPLSSGSATNGVAWVDFTTGFFLDGEAPLVKVHDLAVSGREVFAACGAPNGIHKRDSAGTWTHHNDAEAIIMKWLKDRLMAASASNAYEVTGAGAAPPSLRTLEPGWTFTDIAELGPFIYYAAINEQAGQSVIHHFGPRNDLSTLEWKGTSKLPRNHLAYSLTSSEGFLYIGCGRKTIGTRSDPRARDPILFTAQAGGTGELAIITVAEAQDEDETTSREIRALEPIEEGVLVGWTPSDFQGIARYHSTFESFTQDLDVPLDAGQARVTDILNSGKGATLIAVPSVGVYYEDVGVYASSTKQLVTSIATWRTAALKLAQHIQVAHKPLDPGESIAVYYSTAHPDEDDWTLAGTSDIEGSEGAHFALDDVISRQFTLRFVFERGTDTGQAPTLTGYTLRAFPHHEGEDAEYLLQRVIRIEPQGVKGDGTLILENQDTTAIWKSVLRKGHGVVTLEEADASWEGQVIDIESRRASIGIEGQDEGYEVVLTMLAVMAA